MINGFIKLLLFFLSPFILIVIIEELFYWSYYFVDKMRPIKNLSTYKPRSVIKILFFDFPKWWAFEKMTHNPNHFQEFGVHLVAGEQGSGKTIFVTWFLMEMKKQYPNLKIRTNYNFVHEDAPIEKWEDIILHNNGEYGQIDVLDEIQNWFSSLASKDFPVEMLNETTQQRKQRKMILGTSQVFSRTAKPIREQARFVYEPFTIFGVLTIVRKYKPVLDESASIKKMRLVKIFFIPQTPELRNSYDTYKKIVDMSKTGFYERNWDNEIIIKDKNK